MAKPKDGHHDFFIQIPDALWEAMNVEAIRQERSATRQLIVILRERYPHAAEKVPPPKKRPGRPPRKESA